MLKWDIMFISLKPILRNEKLQEPDTQSKFKVMPGGMVTLSGLGLFRERAHPGRDKAGDPDQDQLHKKEFPHPWEADYISLSLHDLISNTSYTILNTRDFGTLNSYLGQNS